MKIISFASFLLIVVTLTSCSSEPPSIHFGKDQCALCKMTIMDKKFGAVLVNQKSKQLKFDSGECMVQYLTANKDFEPAQFLIINYTKPEELLDATAAFYLHGGEVNSPMGGQLAAFKSRSDAEVLQKDLKAELILWAEVLKINF